MRAGDEGGPLVSWQRLEASMTVGGLGLAGPPVDERSGVAGIVEGAQHPPMFQRHPRQLSFMGTFADPSREQQLLSGEGLHHRPG
jgi:hypothetical protein